MGLRQITAPVSTPVSLTEAKAHLRVDHTDEDTLIGALIEAATEYVETWLGRALIDQTWDLILDSFPSTLLNQTLWAGFWGGAVASTTGAIKIPKPPLIEVVDVFYVDATGLEQTMNSADYYVDTASRFGWIVPQGSGATWPATIDAINSVRIRFRAGYLDYSASPPAGVLPGSLRSAILLIIGAMYEHREQTVVGTIANKLPSLGIEDLLLRHRVDMSMA